VFHIPILSYDGRNCFLTFVTAGHFLGLPDLYDTTTSTAPGSGLGSYSLMANSWGYGKNFPPQLDPWCKEQLGWGTITELTSPGVYSLTASYTTNQYYKISRNFPSGEYLLIENRRKLGFDAMMPGQGFVIYHVDSNAPGNSNEGYPGQTGWPGNGNHYKIAVLQADGLYHLEKGTNAGDGKDMWRNSVSGIGPFSTTGTYPNTDAYKNGIISGTGISITNISLVGETMSFTYSFI
jgi:hypothetical protein